MKALLRVKLDVSLPSNSEGVDEEQETRQLDKSARTATASSSSGVLDDMPRSLGSLRIKPQSPTRYACLFICRHALTESTCEYCLLLLARLHRRRFCKWPECVPYLH